MPFATLASKGQLVIPKEIREALGVKPREKVFFRMVKDHLVEIAPLPEDLVRHFWGIFKKGSSLTGASLKEREGAKSVKKKACSIPSHFSLSHLKSNGPVIDTSSSPYSHI